MHLERETHNEQETFSFGSELARQITPGSVIAFYGDLGTGKTRLIQGICSELGIQEHVASPTFAIVNEYVGNRNIKIFHFDFYRLKSLHELREIGLEEYFQSGGICLIEWADRIEPALPEERIDIRLVLGASSSERRITIDTHTTTSLLHERSRH